MKAIHRRSLIKALEIRTEKKEWQRLLATAKIPLDMEERFKQLMCLDWRGDIVVVADVLVKASNSDATNRVTEHRIFVICPECGREIPFGRYHQHTGTKTCSSSKLRKVNTLSSQNGT